MELLEREEALALLAAAHEAAARGEGRVALVSGEPGIGKTSLVARFAAGLEDASRVLLGTCDDLLVPRPLGPFRDLVGGVSAELEQALAARAAPHHVHSLLLAELERPPRPTVLVLEDVHWADDATLDAITVLGRRIGSLPALLVLTFRGGEAPPGHPLRAAVGTIPAERSLVLELAPLSAAAVASLAGDRADEVYAASGGNPFFVSELLADETEGVPASVANSVRGRAARLDDASRHVVELVSVVPNRVAASLLDTLLPDWAAAAEEPERRQLLEVGVAHVRFRHELARHAIRSGIPIAGRRHLHAEILRALLAADADPAEIVHHAEAAGAEHVVAEHALVAARRAAALGSNRQAYFHYRRASNFLDRRAPVERATILEELAKACYAVYRLEDAFSAVERSIAEWAKLEDAAAVGRCTLLQSRLHWHAGDGIAARSTARAAIEILEPLGESVELARAYSALSQLENLAEDNERALAWGERALELADRLGDDTTRAHVLVNIASVRLDVDHRDTSALLEAHEVADAAGERHEAARALGNLSYALMSWAEAEPALEQGRRALDYAEANELYNLASYIAVTLAWQRLRAGEWDEAERAAQAEIDKGITVAQLVAKTVLAELAVRRGDEDASERLADLAAQAARAHEPQRIVPVLELEVEWALTRETPMPIGRLEALLEEIPLHRMPGGWGAVRVAAWATVAGLDVALDRSASAPYAAMLRADWAGAADAFGAAAWSYDRALMLSLLEAAEPLLEALEIARGLGAEPLARRVTKRLRELGVRVPAGARHATRANPAGLTTRQLEVLALVVEGLTNSEIAERLVVSPRTAEHHVGAVLAKLGATTRREAARRASELRLVTDA